MVGRVSSGEWWGSGTAISHKVVLSAAHVFFNEEILDSYPGPFEWNLRHSPSNRNFDVSARSYRYFSDYAEATRRFQPDDPGMFSYEQFNLDVITLIFFEDVANGSNAGWGGDRITDNVDKMIVGYSNLNYSSSDPRNHRMHSTSLSGSPAEFIFANYNDRLGSTRRLYHTYDLSAGPGNSGGPVFGLIEFSSGIDWGVVGIHVGGIIGEESITVGIDNDVYDLMEAAISDSGETASSDDHGDTRNTATKIELNRSVSGNLETQGDIDYFRFSLRDEGTTTISTTGRTDTLGTLINNSGNFIATNDDGGSGENFSIARKLNPGTYYIVVSSSSNKETGKYSLRVNFTKTIKLPDLVVDSVGVDKRSVVTGELIRVTCRRSNNGDKNSGLFDHGIYLSKDRTITTGDRQLANLSRTSMSAGVSRTFSQEVTIQKNVAPGTYYIGYILDAGRRIEETSETNNTGYTVITVVKPAPDLVLNGSGDIIGQNIQHPNGNIFNQVLLTGQYIKLKARPGQITRISFMDENEDIVQVEFSGNGTFTINLDPATYLSPALPPRYNQTVRYVTGKASIVIEGADSSTFFSIFTVGRINAVNQALFPRGQRYDAQADIKLVEVINSTGFGGMQLSNAVFSGSTGKVGVDARDVPIAVRLIIGDISASGDATPYLLFGEGSFTTLAANSGLHITGGDLYQSNRAQIVAISEAENLVFQANVMSDGRELRAQTMRGSFDFIDQPISNFIPKSLDGKTYRFDYGFDELPVPDITFSGHTSGTFRDNRTTTFEGSSILGSVTGTFNLRNDSTSQNMAHLTLVGQIITISVDGEVNLSGSIEELYSEYEIILAKSVRIEMLFISPGRGSFSDVTTLTDGSTETYQGTFEQL